MADKPPLVSRIPLDVVRAVFKYYGVADTKAQSSIIRTVTSQFPDDDEINRNTFQIKLEQEVFRWHERTVVADADDEATDMSEVDLIQPDGEVLTTEEYDALADVDDEDLRAAITDWKTAAPDRFSNLLEADEP